MLRLFVSASIFVIVLGLAGLPARAQSSSDATSKSLRVAQSISPTQQEEQRAAKSWRTPLATTGMVHGASTKNNGVGAA